MRNILLTLTVFFLNCYSLSLRAQIKVSIGLEMLSALGDFKNTASFGAGPTAGIEYELTSRSSVTLRVGHLFLSPEDRFESIIMIPLQMGFKVYLNSNESGIYLFPQVGVHRLNIERKSINIGFSRISGRTESFTDPSYALGFGYLFEENFDLSVRYNIISDERGNTAEYACIRAAYNF